MAPATAASASGDALAPTPSGSSSFFNVVAAHPDPATENLPATAHGDDTATIASALTGGTMGVLAEEAVPTPRARSPKALPALPPAGDAPLPTGEVDDAVFASIRKNSLSVRFEVNIVKVRAPRP
jgi:hypothetical protein